MCRDYDCSSDVELIVEDCLLELVDKGQPFTAFDVTLAVRKQTDETIYHRDIVGLVHNLMDNRVSAGEYRRDAHPLHQAILYKKEVVAGPAYPSKAKGVTLTIQQPKSPYNFGKSVTKTGPTVAKQAKSTVDSRKADKNGAITISKDMVSKVNWHEGDQLYLHSFNNHVVVSADGSLQSRKKTVSTVDCKGNLKVRKNTLKAAGIQKATLNVKAFKNSVEIR